MPGAPVFTTFFDDARFGDRLDPRRVRPWALQRILGGRRFRSLLPLYPLYFSTLDLRGVPLVVSSSVAFSKAVRTSRSGLHVSYVHTTMRYGWDLEAYLAGSSYSRGARLAARAVRAPLIAWDRRTARRPDVLVANSENVRERIRRRWGRPAEVIYPPVDTSEFSPGAPDEGFLLIAARLLAYRRLDVAVKAANRLQRELIIVGDGPERARLQRLAGPTVRLTGRLPRRDVVRLFERCHAYLLPGIEDFGIAPVEAQACGRPVVAYRAGGALETVDDGTTGVLYDHPTPDALAQAIERLDSITFDPSVLRQAAQRFDRANFFAGWRALLDRLGVDQELYASSDEQLH